MSRAPARSQRATAGAKLPAAVLPIARVAVDVSLAHLDRAFDYQVAASDSEAAQPGTRVRVRFAGRLLDGYVLERVATSDHEGRLGFLERVVSPEPVLTTEVAALARAVADRYAGSMADVLRLAIPPRHARTEASAEVVEIHDDTGDRPPDAEVAEPDGTSWQSYRSGAAFLTAVRNGRPARAVWQALPGENWPLRLAELAATAARVGRGAVLVVPDAKDLQRLDAALAGVLPADGYVTLAADLGPAERYRRYLRLSRGLVKVAAGTRAAAFAPVTDLAVVAVFDDGDDLLSEPRAPYPHTREVLMLRSSAGPCALLIGGHSRTAESELLVQSGWAKPIVADRTVVRAAAPHIEAAGDEYAMGADSAAAGARLSPAAFAAARAALQSGRPVLVQVPRRGYLPALSCASCRRPVRCRHCSGPLALGGPRRPLTCRWCGVAEAHFNCPACGSVEYRTTVVGARRTAEELGRAFPGVPVIISAGDTVRTVVPAEPALVVATPGAEPLAQDGYGAALLLDGYALLGRASLGAAQEALRRWMAAAALVVPAAAGGRVVVGSDTSLPTVQALIRWDPAGHAALELAARQELGFPPTVAMASIQGPEAEVGAAVGSLQLLIGGQILGPVSLDDLPSPSGSRGGAAPPTAGIARVLLRVPPTGRRQLAVEVKRLASARSARKDEQNLRLRIDPVELF